MTQPDSANLDPAELLAQAAAGLRCPACFGRAGRAATCRHCGLAFTDPRIPQLVGLTHTQADGERRRQALIAQIRATASGTTAQLLPRSPTPVPAAWVGGEARPRFPAGSAPPGTSQGAPGAPTQATPSHTTPSHTTPSHTVREPSPPSPTASAPPRVRRRLTVPVLLLTIGVSLVGIAALFFLTVAWFVAGATARALILAGITAITIATAAWLVRRLPTTAEGIAVLSAMLLTLDAWGLRSSGFIGSTMSGALYLGLSLLAVAAVLRVWARLSTLRTPSLMAALAFPTAIGFVIGGLLVARSLGTIPLGLLGAGIGGLAVALPAPWTAATVSPLADRDRVALVSVGLVGLVGSTVTAVALGSLPVALSTLSGGVLVALGYAWLLRPGSDRVPGQRTFRQAAMLAAVANVALIGPTTAIHGTDSVVSLALTLVLTTCMALTLDLAKTRAQVPRWLVFLALVPAAGSAFLAGLMSIASTAMAMLGAPWHAQPWQQAQALAPTTPWLTGASLLAAGAVFASPGLANGPFRRWRGVYSTVLVLTGVGLLGVAGVLVVTAFALAYASLIGLRHAGQTDRAPAARRASPPTPRSVPQFSPGTPVRAAAPTFAPSSALPGGGPAATRVGTSRPNVAGWLTAGFLAAGIGLVASLASPALFFPAAGAAVVLPMAQLAVLRTHRDLTFSLTATAIAVAALAALFAPGALGAALGGWWATTQAWAVPGLALAVVLLLGATLPAIPTRVRELTAIGGGLMALFAGAVAAFALAGSLGGDVDALGAADLTVVSWLLALAMLAVTLLACVILYGQRHTHSGAVHTVLASALTALVAMSGVLLAQAVGLDRAAAWSAGLALGALVIAASTALPPRAQPMAALIQGRGPFTLLLCAIGLAGADPSPGAAWLAVGCATACAVVLATYGSREVPAATNLGVGTLGGVVLLTGLLGVDRDVPGGMAPLVLAGVGICTTAWLLVWRTGPGTSVNAEAGARLRAPARLATYLSVLGTLALLHAMTSDRALRGYTEGAVWRSFVLVAVTIAVAALSLRGLRSAAWRRLANVGALGSVAAIWALAILRTWSQTLVEEGESLTRLRDGTDVWPGIAGVDLWLGFALLASGTIVVLARLRLGGTAARRLYGLTGGLSAVLFAMMELASNAGESTSRLAWVGVLLAVVLFVGIVWRELLGLLVTVGACLGIGWVAVNMVEPFHEQPPAELLTAPVAVAAVAAGVIEMQRNLSVRSWPAIGGGLALATLPSLLYDGGEPGPVRPLLLAIACVAMIVWGVAARLQAPLVIGSVVLLIHATVTFWPWITLAYEQVWWWLWLGLGGVLLIVVAARYEQGRRLARSAFDAVTALR